MTISTQEVLDLLRRFECPNTTFIEPDGSWPIVWSRARGNFVWNPEGRRYLDLTAAFGVAAAGHGKSEVVRAARDQMGRLLHAMGDVHPHPLKAELARELSRITFERWSSSPGTESPSNQPTRGRTLFCNSGFEAVEAALKTALLATGKPGIIAFEGAYHGLGYGALNATERSYFSKPFRSQLSRFGFFVPFPQSVDDLEDTRAQIERLFRRKSIGAILVEPVQGRAGIRVPPPEFLPLLKQMAEGRGALLIVDEVFTGFGRTGTWFACEHSRVIPDLICLGKALTGGFPLSACVGKAEIMERAWPPSQGEALHTSTFLGHPVGCAMALANIAALHRANLINRSARLGKFLLSELHSLTPGPNLQLQARGLGLMAGLELRTSPGQPATDATLAIVKAMLKDGFILLPEGEHANVIGFTPPLIITRSHLKETIIQLQKHLRSVSADRRKRSDAPNRNRSRNQSRLLLKRPMPNLVP